MKFRRVSLVCAFWVAWGLGLVRGQEAHMLTLKEAQEITLRSHPRITEAELETLASRQVVTEVRSAYLPTLTFNATAVGAGESNTRMAAGGLSNSQIFDRNAEGVAFTQMITDFGRTAHLLNSSRLESRAQGANAEATREEILLQVDVAFFAALRAQSVLAVARQTLDTRKLLLDQVQALAQNKLRSDLDLSFAQVAYEEGKLLVAKAENDLDEAFNVLSTLLGDREQRSYRLIEEPAAAPTPVDSPALIDLALSKRPDLSRLRFEWDAAVQYAKAQQALNYPTINAFGGGGIIPVRDSSRFDSHYGAAGVNLSLPVFDGGLNAAKRSEAELRSQAAEAKLRDAENNAIHDVRTATLNTNYAFERLDLTQKLFDNASQAFNLAEARYKLGSSSIVELSQSQLEKTQAEIDYTSAKYEYQIQRAILNFQAGSME